MVQSHQTGRCRRQAAAGQVERCQLGREVGVQPGAPGRGGQPHGLGHQRAPDPPPLEFRRNDRVEQEGVPVAVSAAAELPAVKPLKPDTALNTLVSPSKPVMV